MLSYFHAFILSLVEGLTEFIPVSSTGHMIITSWLMGVGGTAVNTFEIFIQLGAILSIVALYPNRFLDLIPKFKATNQQLGIKGFAGLYKFALACLPVFICGFLFHSYIKSHLFSPFTVAWGLIIGGILLIFVEYRSAKESVQAIEQISFRHSLLIGFFQCMALWPGMSRSGSTIIGSMLIGFNRKVAAEFSFLIAVPVMCVAVIYDLLKSLDSLSISDMGIFTFGFIASFLVSLIAVRYFMAILGSITLKGFGWYRIILGLVVLNIVGVFLVMGVEFSAALFDLILGLDRRIITIRKKLRPQPPLGLREGFVIAELSQHPSADYDLLLQTLRMKKASLDAVLKSLLANKLIIKDVFLKRNKGSAVKLTPKGEKLFLIDNQARNQQILELTYGLAKSEKTQLSHSIELLSDKLKATPALRIAGDPLCRAELFRLIPALGILGDDFLGLGCSIIEVQIIHQLLRNGDVLSEEALNNLLPLDRKDLIVAVNRLVKNGILRKESIKFDRNNSQLSLTSKGKTRAKDNIKRSASKIGTLLRAVSIDQRMLLRALLEKIIYANFDPLMDLRSHQLTVERIDTTEGLNTARAFVIEQLVGLKKHRTLKDTVLDSKNLSYQLLQLDEINGVCEIKKKGSIGEIIHFVMFVDIHDPIMPGELLIRAIEDCFLSKKLKKVLINTESEAKTFIQQALGQSVSEITPQALMTIKALHAKLGH